MGAGVASLVGIGTVIGRALRKKSKDNHAKVAEAQRYSAETINNQECFKINVISLSSLICKARQSVLYDHFQMKISIFKNTVN